jgi:hypothetical protein
VVLLKAQVKKFLVLHAELKEKLKSDATVGNNLKALITLALETWLIIQLHPYQL